MEVDVDTRCTILNYLKLIKKRASGKLVKSKFSEKLKSLSYVAPSVEHFCWSEPGELMTMAKWMREFVATHPQYKQDSVLTDKINYDLFRKCDRIAKGEEQCPELIGNPVNKFKWERVITQTCM